ncbi:hypothetical protein ATANTOWER_012163 [Ataeniobius toweri]|uniref:Uncharacterized protein n=1 Tax=Ataeniobius toweri TaxID=208326 RepID=A0ABU7CAB4_9TELE|nr:hypothetical protein [Ataeniobius toweri]
MADTSMVMFSYTKTSPNHDTPSSVLWFIPNMFSILVFKYFHFRFIGLNIFPNVLVSVYVLFKVFVLLHQHQSLSDCIETCAFYSTASLQRYLRVFEDFFKLLAVFSQGELT